jgi:hypothetical protein
MVIDIGCQKAAQDNKGKIVFKDWQLCFPLSAFFASTI